MPKRQRLLTTANVKTQQGEKQGWATYILHLAPGSLSGRNVCPQASKGCLAACLNTAGRGIFTSTQAARIAKTRRLFADRQAFGDDLRRDIEAAIRKGKREGKRIAIRLNGTSDLPWVRLFPWLEEYKDRVRYYDYSKSLRRVIERPAWYDLTFSKSESNGLDCLKALDAGVRVAVVFSTLKGQSLPAYWCGREVIDGDANDLRFLERGGIVVGLRAKGSDGKADASGFVVQVAA